MNITTLLNRKPSLLVSATKLTSLVLSNNRQEIQTKSLLLRKRKEISKQRIRTFAGLQADANRGDIANNALLGGGLAAGGGLSLLRGKQIRKPIKPGKLSGLGRLSKGSVIANTLFAGLDFGNRKSAGQTNLQAGLGAGGGAVGGIAGAAIGQSLIPIPVLGALIGGFVGSTIGSSVADRASGVTGSDFRRLQFERESIRLSGRTEFTDGLDRFDSALGKFRKYDDDLKGFILRATGNDNQDRAFSPIIPRRGGGATQAQIDSAYQKGIGVGIGGLATAVIGTVVAIKAGGFLLGGAALAKLRALLGLVVKNKGKIDVKVLGGGSLNKIIKKIQPKVTKSKTKPFSKRKVLKGQDKVTSSDTKDLNEIIKISKEANKEQINIFKKFNDKLNKTNSGKPRTIQKNLFRSNKNVEKIKEKFNVEEIKSNVTQQQIQELIKKGRDGLSPDSPLFKLFNKNNLKSDNTIIKEGDNYFANSISGSTTIVGGEPDPYLASLNTIKAYSELTA
tara:strand:+ start:3034 stop:4551 length:1518 start_codon:yes stop_codon:yes gene_type:complete